MSEKAKQQAAFDMDLRYRQEVGKYGKKDAVVALAAYVFFVIFSIISTIDFFAFTGRENIAIELSLLMWSIVFFLGTLPVYFIILIKRQGFASLGIHKEKMWISLRLGLLFSIIPLTCGIIPVLLYGGEYNGYGTPIFGLLILIIGAVTEDIFFIGFLQTRMYGLFKNDKVAVCVCAALFSIGHMPNWIRGGGLDLDGLIISILMVVSWFFMHIIFVAIFKRYFSLFPVIILHTMVNLSSITFWIVPNNHFIESRLMGITITTVLLVAIGIWTLLSRRYKDKTSF